MHHPIFSKFKCFTGDVEAEYMADFLGVKTKLEYYTDTHIESHVASTEYPPFSEEYFEWIDILASVILAKNSYTMIELGAGWGRWMSRAFMALKQIHPEMPCSLIGVEAEPTHFKWMVEHCAYNKMTGINLINAAVDVEDGEVGFYTGKPSEWYGQCIGGETKVKAISLKSILDKLDLIDIIDLDVQNFEYKILSSVEDQLEKVKKIHIGTHSVEVEKDLREMFTRLGWKCVNDYSLFTEHSTEYGVSKFNDGVQTWVNKLFVNEYDCYINSIFRANRTYFMVP